MKCGVVGLPSWSTLQLEAYYKFSGREYNNAQVDLHIYDFVPERLKSLKSDYGIRRGAVGDVLCPFVMRRACSEEERIVEQEGRMEMMMHVSYK
jgi:hypothetical protein